MHVCESWSYQVVKIVVEKPIALYTSVKTCCLSNDFGFIIFAYIGDIRKQDNGFKDLLEKVIMCFFFKGTCYKMPFGEQLYNSNEKRHNT